MDAFLAHESGAYKQDVCHVHEPIDNGAWLNNCTTYRFSMTGTSTAWSVFGLSREPGFNAPQPAAHPNFPKKSSFFSGRQIGATHTKYTMNKDKLSCFLLRLPSDKDAVRCVVSFLHGREKPQKMQKATKNECDQNEKQERKNSGKKILPICGIKWTGRSSVNTDTSNRSACGVNLKYGCTSILRTPNV